MVRFLGKIFFTPLKWILKALFKLLALIVLLVCIAMACGNWWIPPTTSCVLTKLSGFKTTLSGSHGNLFKGRIDCRDINIHNPKTTFQYDNFIRANSIVADVDMTSLIKDTIVIEELTIDIDAISLVKDKNGTSNYSLFSQNISQFIPSNEKTDTNTKSTSSTSNKKSIFIKKLTIALGKVDNIDEQKGTKKIYTINYRREFTDVSNFSKLGIQLAGDLGKYGLSIIIDSVISSVSDLGGVAVDSVKSIKNTTLDAAGTATKSIESGLKKTGNSVSSGFKKLFGK